MRDMFLTEAMGKCWHKPVLTTGDDIDSVGWVCEYCGDDPHTNVELNTWEGFGKLWEWASSQEWWDTPSWAEESYEQRKHKLNDSFICYYGFHEGSDALELINPDRFADAVYKYLKERS